jgi:serine/threonine protein kinase
VPGHWKLGGQIGKGSFGNVHVGLNEDSGDLIAVKILSLNQPSMTPEVSHTCSTTANRGASSIACRSSMRSFERQQYWCFTL